MHVCTPHYLGGRVITTCHKLTLYSTLIVMCMLSPVFQNTFAETMMSNRSPLPFSASISETTTLMTAAWSAVYYGKYIFGPFFKTTQKLSGIAVEKRQTFLHLHERVQLSHWYINNSWSLLDISGNFSNNVDSKSSFNFYFPFISHMG